MAVFISDHTCTHSELAYQRKVCQDHNRGKRNISLLILSCSISTIFQLKLQFVFGLYLVIISEILVRSLLFDLLSQDLLLLFTLCRFSLGPDF